MEIISADTKSLIYLSKLLAILRNLAETFVLVQTFPIWINVLVEDEKIFKKILDHKGEKNLLFKRNY